MKIAVFGWYGHDNAGDERIKYCLQEFLLGMSGIDSVEFFDLHNNAIKGKTNKFDHYDLVIIGGGGLILSQCNYHDFIYGIKTKIATVGISVERRKLTGNSRLFAQALIEKSMVVLVRDQESFQKLAAYDLNNKVKLSYDLTFLKPFDIVPAINEPTIGVNLLPKPAGMHYSTLNTPIISRLLEILNRVGMDRMLKMVHYRPLIAHLQQQYDLMPLPLYSAAHNDVPDYQKNDVEFLKLFFKNVPERFIESDMDQCKILLSMRLHGTIFAVQKGIPSIAITYLPKNRNFMRAAGLEDYVLDDVTEQGLERVLTDLQNKYSQIREQILEYRSQAMSQVRADLTQIMNLV